MTDKKKKTSGTIPTQKDLAIENRALRAKNAALLQNVEADSKRYREQAQILKDLRDMRAFHVHSLQLEIDQYRAGIKACEVKLRTYGVTDTGGTALDACGPVASLSRWTKVRE